MDSGRTTCGHCCSNGKDQVEPHTGYLDLQGLDKDELVCPCVREDARGTQ